MDIFQRRIENIGHLGAFAALGEKYFFFPKLEGEIGPVMKFQGKEMIVWSINSYLGLANHPEVRKADADAVAEHGLAYPMGSRMMSGNTDSHEELERQLAAFVHKEDAILVNFGYQAVLSFIDALVDRHDVIVYDSDSHACIVDGVRLHMGKRFSFDHNDIDSLEKNLVRATRLTEKSGGGILVISEGVFGMRGDQGKLKEIVALKEKFDFRLFVDDAHGFGVLGRTGAGAGEEQGVQDDIDLYFSTFAKSMAGIGAFAAGSKEIIRFLRFNTRSQIYAKSLPMGFVKGGLKRLEILRNSSEQKDKLWSITNHLQNGLKDNGFDIGNTDSCVTPVYMKGEVVEATEMVKDLRETYRIFCSIVVYPVVPKGVILLRLIPTAAHEIEHVEETLKAFQAVKQKLQDGVYMERAKALAF